MGQFHTKILHTPWTTLEIIYQGYICYTVKQMFLNNIFFGSEIQLCLPILASKKLEKKYQLW